MDENGHDLEKQPTTQKTKGLSAPKPVTTNQKDENKASRLVVLKDIFNPQGTYLSIWNKIFVTASVFAVSLDPLFFYVLIIDQQNKCLEMDSKLKIVALLLRSFTDIIFLVHFLCKICDLVEFPINQKQVNHEASIVDKTKAPSTPKAGGDSVTRKLTPGLFTKNIALKKSLIVDFLSLLPIPQLVIVLSFYKMKGSGYLKKKGMLNALLLGQYVPRIYRIHLSSSELHKNTGIWVKGVFNFFLYILASHVLGAFWYFFSIQLEMSCWHQACVDHSTNPTECMNTFFCSSQGTARNVTFLDEFCPLDTPDGATSPPFNFGIFRDSLQNHNIEHIEFGKKFVYSFWWGLRNLSNFGTNLTTTAYVWENLFAILISVVGLLLFLYLIGNLQTFMQMEATKTEEMRRKIDMKKLDVQEWVHRNEIPNELKKEIIKNVKQKLKGHKDADLQSDLFSILPVNTRKSLKRFLCVKILRTIPMLKNMNIIVLDMMCDYLKPVIYNENSFPFRIGDPLDRMLFIIEGTMWTYSTSDGGQDQAASPTTKRMVAKPLEKGQLYGKELLEWASATSTQFPVSAEHVKSQTKVEALVLMAKDLATVVSKCQLFWELNKCINPEEKKKVAVTVLLRRLKE